MESEKFPFQLFLATLKTAQQPLLCNRIFVKHYFHRNIFVAESNLNFKIYKWKLKIEVVYSVVYSTVQVFLHSRSQKMSPEVFCKKSVLNVFSNVLLKCSFTGKQLCQSLFLMKFLKNTLRHRCFPVNIAKFLRTPILKSICERLLLT